MYNDLVIMCLCHTSCPYKICKASENYKFYKVVLYRLSLINRMKFQRYNLNLNLIFKLVSSKNRKNILCHYLSCQIQTFKLSAIPHFQNRPALLYTDPQRAIFWKESLLFNFYHSQLVMVDPSLVNEIG